MKTSRSSFYYKVRHKDDKFLKDKSALQLVKDIFDKKRQKAGIQTIAMILQNKHGIIMNLKKIARIKKQYGLTPRIRKKNPYNVLFKNGLEH